MKKPIDPQYRAKVYNALKTELGLKKSENDFYNDLDTKEGYADKVYGALQNELGLKKSREDFMLLVKKKDNTNGTLTATELDSRSKEAQSGGSLVGKDYSKKLDFVKKADERLEQQFEEEKQTLQPLLSNYNTSVAPTKETIDTAKKQAESLNKNEGFGWYKKLKDVVYGTPTSIGAAPNPFYNPTKVGNFEEKTIIAKQIANEKGISVNEVSPEEIDNTYIKQKTKEIVDAETERKTEEFIEDLSSDDQQKIKEHFKVEAQVLGGKKLSTLFEIEGLKEQFDRLDMDVKNAIKTHEENIKYNVSLPESYYQENLALEQKRLETAEMLKEKLDAFTKIDDALLSVENEIDLFKRNYNKIINPLAKAGLSFVDFAQQSKVFMDNYHPGTILSNMAGDKIAQAFGVNGEQQRDAIDNEIRSWTQRQKGKLAKSQRLDDIQGITDLEGITEFVFDIASEEAANITVMAATGGASLPLMGVRAGGAKFQQLEDEEKASLGSINYEWYEKYGSPLISAFVEPISEKVSLGQVKYAKRIFKTATQKQLKESTLSYFKNRVFTKANTGKYFKDIVEEGGSEGLATLAENIGDNLLLGKDNFVLDGVGESIVTGSVMSGVVYKAPMLLGPITQPFRKSDTNQKIGEAYVAIENINSQLQAEGISDASVKELESQKETITKGVTELIEKDLGNVENLSKEDVTELINLERQKYNARKEAQQISDDTALKDDVRKKLLTKKAAEIDAANIIKDQILESAKNKETEQEFVEKAIDETPSPITELNPENTNETAPKENIEVDGGVQPRVEPSDNKGEDASIQPTPNDTSSKAKVEVKRVTSQKGFEYDVTLDESGKPISAKNPKTGKVVQKFIERKKKDGTKTVVVNGLWSDIESKATGTITEQQAKKERKEKVKTALDKSNPNDAYSAARDYVVRGNPLSLESAKKETGLSDKEVKWATRGNQRFKKNSESPSIERAAEQIVANSSQELDIQDVRQALIDIISSKESRNALEDEIIFEVNEANDRLDDQQFQASINNLTPEEFAIFEATKAEDDYISELSDTDVVEYFNEKINEYEQGKQADTEIEARESEEGGVNESQQTTSKSNPTTQRKQKSVAEKNAENLQWAKENLENIIKSYQDKLSDNEQNKLDPDKLREEFSEIGYDGTNVPEYRLAEKYVRDILFERLLDKAAKEGNKTITFLTGTGGSGKTYSTRKLDFSKKGVIFDVAFNSFTSLDAQLKKAQEKGFEIEVVAVYNDPLTAFKNTINRGLEKNRWLSLFYFINAFKRNQNKINQLLETYPNVTLTAIDNSNNITKEATTEEAKNWSYELSDSQIEELLKTLENESRGFNKNQISAITKDLQRIVGSNGKRTIGMERNARTIADRVDKLRQEESRDSIRDNEGDGLRLDDSDPTAMGLSLGGPKAEDASLSEEGAVKQKDERQSRFRRFWNKTTRSNAGVNSKVAEVVRGQINQKAEIMDVLKHEQTRFEKIRKHIRKNSKNPKDIKKKLIEVNKYLSGNKNADVSFLSEAQKQELDYFRDRIDTTSQKIISKIEKDISGKETRLENDTSLSELAKNSILKSIETNKALIETIQNNKGQYLNRSYQAFTDDKYLDRLTSANPNQAAKKRINNAIDYLMSQDPNLTKEEARTQLFNYLDGLKSHGDMMEALIKGSAQAPFLKKRKEIPIEIQELLGVVNDPVINYVNTLYKMNTFLANVEYQQNLEKSLEEVGLLSREMKEGYTRLVPDTDSWSSLHNVFVPVEVKQSIEDLQPLGYIKDNAYRNWVKVTGLVRLGKTVLSPTTAFRNIISGHFLAANAGFTILNNPKLAIESLALAWGNAKNREQMRKEASKLIKLGVLLDGSKSSEILATLNDISKRKSRVTNRTTLDKAFELAQKFYALGDDSYKVYGFYTYVNRYEKSGYSKKEAEEKASQRIRDTFPTYSKLPKNIQALRRFVVTGTFVSFPYEVFRTSFNAAKYLAEDIKEGRKEMALKQFTGMVAANAMATGLSVWTMGLLGIDDEDDDVIRNMSPEWQKDSTLIYFGKDKQGHPIFMDATAMFPSETILKPFKILFEERQGRDTGDKLTRAFTETLKPFLGMDVSFQGFNNLISNKNNYDQQLYNGDNLAEGIFNDPGAVTNYVLKQMGPGAYNNISEFARANNIAPEFFGDKLTNYGREYTNRDALLALFGVRMTTLNYGAGMMNLGYEINDKKRFDRSKVLKQLKRPTELSNEKINELVKETYKSEQINGEQSLNLIAGANKLGVSKTSQIKALKATGYSKKDIGFLLNNEVPVPSPVSKSTIKNQITKTQVVEEKNIKNQNTKIDYFLENIIKYNTKLIENYNKK